MVKLMQVIGMSTLGLTGGRQLGNTASPLSSKAEVLSSALLSDIAVDILKSTKREVRERTRPEREAMMKKEAQRDHIQSLLGELDAMVGRWETAPELETLEVAITELKQQEEKLIADLKKPECAERDEKEEMLHEVFSEKEDKKSQVEYIDQIGKHHIPRILRKLSNRWSAASGSLREEKRQAVQRKLESVVKYTEGVIVHEEASKSFEMYKGLVEAWQNYTEGPERTLTFEDWLFKSLSDWFFRGQGGQFPSNYFNAIRLLNNENQEQWKKTIMQIFVKPFEFWGKGKSKREDTSSESSTCTSTQGHKTVAVQKKDARDLTAAKFGNADVRRVFRVNNKLRLEAHTQINGWTLDNAWTDYWSRRQPHKVRAKIQKTLNFLDDSSNWYHNVENRGPSQNQGGNGRGGLFSFLW